MGSVEGQRARASGTGACQGQCRGPGELIDLACELTGPEVGERRFAIEAIATQNSDGALEQEPCRGTALSDVVDDFTGCEISLWPTCEALGSVHLGRIEHGKHLVATSLEDGHSAIPAV